MAVAAGALTTVEKAKAYLRLDDLDAGIQTSAIDIYNQDTNPAAPATAATVQVTDTQITLIITGGDDVGTSNLTFAANTTVSAMVTAINAVAGWVARALTYADALTADLVELAQTSALGLANRQQLQIVDNRGLELLIDQVTAEIERWLDRHIVSATYSKIINLGRGGVNRVTLPEPDVTRITKLAFDHLEAFTCTYTGTDQSARVEVTDTSVRTLSDGSTSTDEEYTFASNALVSDLVTTINAAGFDFTTVTKNDGPSADLVREGVRDCKSPRIVSVYAWDDFEGEYVVEYTPGTFTLDWFIWPFSSRSGFQPTTRRVLVEFVAGFASVAPADVEQVALEMISTIFFAGARDKTIASESLGDYSYSLVPVGADAGAMAKDWQRRLETYGRVLP